MENANLNPLFYAAKAAALSECGWRHALVWRAPSPLPRMSPPRVSLVRVPLVRASLTFRVLRCALPVPWQSSLYLPQNLI
jgi:hypothetical protein